MALVFTTALILHYGNFYLIPSFRNFDVVFPLYCSLFMWDFNFILFNSIFILST